MNALLSLSSILLVAACAGGDPHHRGLTLGDEVSPQISADCQLAQTRCTRCHDSDRITTSRRTSESAWMVVVDRMRRRPGSGIAPAETRPIVRCLVFRSNRNAP